MDVFDRDVVASLLEPCQPPCLSLYQPTHRHYPDSQQDAIRFKNLVRRLESSLLEDLSAREVESLLEPFTRLADDRTFWNHGRDGLAVLGSRGTFQVYRLQRPVPELAIVADSFHVKPLLRILQSADRFQVLGLSRQSIKLYEGNRDTLDEIEPADGVPRTITDALGEELTEPHLTVASYGGGGEPGSTMHHGHGGKKAEIDIDAERFFRAVDRAVLEHHSQPTGLPLILAALPEHHHLFREVSHNPNLIDGAIDVFPDALDEGELEARAWQVMEPSYRERMRRLVEAYGAARAKDLGHEDPLQVARAIVDGRVGTLLIEADRTVGGRVDAETGAVVPADLARPDVDDVLDDLATMALKMGGRVVIMPADAMPTDTGLAAIYRY